MSSVKGLSQEEHQRLLLSVGTHRGQRPLSPIEVASLFAKVLAAGGSLSDCASAASLEGTTQVSRFLRLLKLPGAVWHLVGWGSVAGTVGFSSGAEIARLENNAEEEALVNGVLINRLSGSEVRQVVQLRKRSKRTLEECLSEVVGMRPRVEKRYVYVGAITNDALKKSLAALTQAQRDQLLGKAVGAVLGAKGLALTRLGTDRFTLVGSAEFGEAMTRQKDSLEQEINTALAGTTR
jgi:hypothetical protein